MATTETATRIAVVRNESEIKAMTQSAILSPLQIEKKNNQNQITIRMNASQIELIPFIILIVVSFIFSGAVNQRRVKSTGNVTANYIIFRRFSIRQQRCIFHDTNFAFIIVTEMSTPI